MFMWCLSSMPIVVCRVRVPHHDVGVGAGAITPLRGYMPNIRAGVVQHVSTQRSSVISPVTTPWYSSSIRCSTPPMPFGIFEKSPMPSSFWSLKQNGQWSVLTTASSFVRRPRHRSAWWLCSSCGERNGRRAHPLRALEARPASVSSRVSHRYCGQVSANTLRPVVARGGDLLERVAGRHVHDVQRHVAGDLRQHDRAVVASASSVDGGSGVVARVGLAPRQRLRRRARRSRCRSRRAS